MKVEEGVYKRKFEFLNGEYEITDIFNRPSPGVPSQFLLSLNNIFHSVIYIPGATPAFVALLTGASEPR